MLAVLALCAVQFVDVLGGTVVITALPTMLTDLGAGVGRPQSQPAGGRDRVHP